MDTTSALSQQWKERDNKVFSQKAEVHVKQMKHMTGTPRIDPLSRKVAELVTRREMESLGIQLPEPVLKKPSNDLIIPKSTPKKDKKSKNLQLTSSLKSLNPVTSPPNPVTLPTPTKPTLSDIKFPDSDPRIRSGSNRNSTLTIKGNIEANTLTLTPISGQNSKEIQLMGEEKRQNEDKKVSEDMLNNLEHLQAFQEELQREYPELGLNNSLEACSFHTNELNELEEACKDFNSDDPYHKKISGISNENALFNDNQALDQISNRSVCDGSSIHDKKMNLLEKEPEINEIPNLDKQKNEKTLGLDEIPEQNKSLDQNSDKNNLNFSPNDSKTQLNQSFYEKPSKDFGNLQKSYIKASFLHSPQESAPKSIPRCHINLTNCMSSPIYFSVRVHPGSKIKCENGVGPVDSLRRLLLQDPVAKQSSDSNDFYNKSLNWLKERDQKIKEIRENRKDTELEGCTFDPYYEKHKSETKKKEESFEIKPFIPGNKKTKSTGSYTPKIPDNTQTYTALSPADNTIRYKEGFPMENFMRKAKPMVCYRSINFLN